MNRVIITGATGFIGSATLAELQRHGANPIALTRVGSKLPHSELPENLTTLPYKDLGDPLLAEQLRSLKPTTFIHCAWRGVAGAERNEAYQVSTNLPLTLASVNLAAESGCRQWIGLGSQAEYGKLENIIDETAPTKPTTLYGKAKLSAGIAGLALCEASGLAGAWLRVFSTYGPNDSPQWMIPYTIREWMANRVPQLTKCEQRWDYLFVSDAARAIAMLADGKTSGTFNLGSGDASPLKEVVEIIRAEMSYPCPPSYGAIPYRNDQVMHLQANITRLTNAIGWKPQVTLTEGIRQTVRWERTISQTRKTPTKDQT